MPNPGFDAGSLRQRLRDADLLTAFDEAVHTLDVTRVLAVLRDAGLPEEEARRTAATVLVEASMREE